MRLIFQNFMVWLRTDPSVQGLRTRLEHFEEVRQFDRLHGGRRGGSRGPKALKTLS
jgi:hypothetical protein